MESGGTKYRERAVYQRRGLEPTAGQMSNFRERERNSSTLLNVISVVIDRAVVDNTAVSGSMVTSTAWLLQDPQSPTETEDALGAVANGKASGPAGLHATLVKLVLVREPPKTLHHIHNIIAAVWISTEVPQKWKDAAIKV